MESGALLYHEPGSTTIAIQASFILLLNIVNYVLDRAIFCGLVGQILLGIAWGTPGGQFLSEETEKAITDFGYLGLILLVFEGGLTTDAKSLRSNLVLSVIVALTGIATPIGLSFLLIQLCDATILQAFAAGCALSSTSLGTTFTVLKSSGLSNSRLGTVLTSAAMLDDVVGLVLVQVIANIGTSQGQSLEPAVILRPVFVSLGFAVIVPLVCWIIRKVVIDQFPTTSKSGAKKRMLESGKVRFMGNTAILIAVSLGAAYAGTSILFASYLAGAAISWLDAATSVKKQEVAHTGNETKAPVDKKSIKDKKVKKSERKTLSNSNDERNTPTAAQPTSNANENQDLISQSNHEDGPKVENQLKDQECADKEDERQKQIAAERHQHSVVSNTHSPKQELETVVWTGMRVYTTYYSSVVDRILKPFFFASIGFSIPISRLFDGQVIWRGLVYAVLMLFGKLICGLWLVRFVKRISEESRPKAFVLFRYQAQSYYPAAILGSAMVGRGEIGFLIAAVAQSNNIFAHSPEQIDLYLVITWAILLCTIIGPITVGLLVKRVKRLQRARTSQADGKGDPLGIWANI